MTAFRPVPLFPAFLLAFLGVLVAAPIARPARAHPHAWIDISVQILFDRAGRVTGLRETWLFDEYYTVFALEGLGEGGGQPSQSEIDAILHENMKNLAEYAYFTEVERNGEKVAFGPVTEMSSRLRGPQLEMSFVVPFASPFRLEGAQLTYAIFDPTYYVEMLHAGSGDAIRLVGAPAGCSHRLIEPTPPVDAVALAAALDRTETAGGGLGALFAERVEVRCP